MNKTVVKPGVAPAPPGEGEFSLIPRNKLLGLYAAMLQCRAIAKRLPKTLSSGLSNSLRIFEAVSAGLTIDLLEGDAISPAPSDLTPCLVKGVAPKTLLRWWRNPSSRFPARVAGANVIPPSGSIAARLEAAMRLAGHFRAVNNGSVVVVFAASESLRSKPNSELEFAQPFPHSVLRQAAENRLPMLFVALGNRDNEELLSIAGQCGVASMAVDRDDVVAVYRVAFEALSHARHGNGPTLIDARPWRTIGHSAKKKDARNPIAKMELYLAGKGIAFKPVKRRVLRAVDAQLGPE